MRHTLYELLTIERLCNWLIAIVDNTFKYKVVKNILEFEIIF